MIAVGVTGSFASGKSFLLNYLRSAGFTIFSADEYVTTLYQKQDIQNKVLDLLSLKVFDKKDIANLIYSDKKSRECINEFIHPFVSKAIEEFKLQNPDENFIFAEVPLLFESDFDKYFDFVITTYCSEESRLQRAKNRQNFNQELYNKRNLIQIPQEEKIKRANFALNTDCNLIELELQITEFMKLLRCLSSLK